MKIKGFCGCDDKMYIDVGDFRSFQYDSTDFRESQWNPSMKKKKLIESNIEIGKFIDMTYRCKYNGCEFWNDPEGCDDVECYWRETLGRFVAIR